MHKCTCVNVQPNTYKNQIFVHAPAHMPKNNGYCLDKCIAEEVMILWQLGIHTTGCCCGHGNDNLAFIGVENVDIILMEAMGYTVKYNPARPGDNDSFKPMGAGNVLNILKSKT